MKMEKDKKRELVENLLPLLDPEATEIPKKPNRMGKVLGKDLITQHKIFKDARGNPVKLEQVYTWPFFDPVKIDHRQRIGRIIADAENDEEAEAKLAEHLAKYPKSKTAVIRNVQSFLN